MSSSNLHPSAQPAGSLPVAMASNAANLPVVTASDAANLPVVTASNAATLPPAMVSNAANLPVVTAPNAANLSVVTASNATNQNLTNAAQGPVANNMTLPPNNNGGGGVTFASNFVLPHVPNPQQLLAQANLMAQIGLLQTSQPAQTPNRFMFLNQGLFPPFNVHLQQQGQNNG